MFDPSRLTRLITLALAACAVTWAFAGSALARPDVAPATAAPAPAFKAVPGDIDKVPTAQQPASTPVGDIDKVPNPNQVERVLNGIGRGKTGPVVAPHASDDTSTVALVLAIAAILTALGAVSLTVARPQRRPAGV